MAGGRAASDRCSWVDIAPQTVQVNAYRSLMGCGGNFARHSVVASKRRRMDGWMGGMEGRTDEPKGEGGMRFPDCVGKKVGSRLQ